MTTNEGNRGRMIPAAIVAFFAVIAVANGVFVYLAVDTHPGLETDDAYEKGLEYNAEIEKSEANRALKWSGSVAADANGSVKVTILGSNGVPLKGLTVTALAVWPVSAGFDTEVSFEETGESYFAIPALPMRGQWEFRITARDGQGRTFRFDQRVTM